jgi:phage FluMu protein Com
MSQMSPAASFDEVRCKIDGNLLFKAPSTASGEIEIKCKRCNKIRRISLPLKAFTSNMVTGTAAQLAMT